MKIELTADEARVIGCLMEKEVTTPEQYPLSINSLTSACNQKSNRDPVLALSEAAVQQVVDGLMKKHLVSDRSGYGGRVTKYKQTLCNTEFGLLKFSDLERAIVCELLVRGPQSAGELRTRCGRMATIADVSEVDAALAALASHAAGPFVTRLPRKDGARDARYAQLLTGVPAGVEAVAAPVAVPVAVPVAAPFEAKGPASTDRSDLAGRIQALEVQVAELQQTVAAIRSRQP